MSAKLDELIADNTVNTKLLKDIVESQGFNNEKQVEINLIPIPDNVFAEQYGEIKAYMTVVCPESLIEKVVAGA